VEIRVKQVGGRWDEGKCGMKCVEVCGSAWARKKLREVEVG
jgi:hypothetical protein